MRKLVSFLCLFLAVVLVAGAGADGILPVLQTPPPAFQSVVSYHQIMNLTGTYSPYTTDDGGYMYEYKGVTYASYQAFGKALAQEGFKAAETGTGERGEVTALLTKGSSEMDVSYNYDTSTLGVVYSPRMIPNEVDPDHPYTIRSSESSLLPEPVLAISIHAVTGKMYDGCQWIEGTGYQYSYHDIPYGIYSRFSEKLGDEGYSLVSSGKNENGIDTAVVTDGNTELTILYRQEEDDLYVIYPVGVHPRAARLYEDFIPVHAGEPVQLWDQVTLTITGWETADSYRSKYSNKIYPNDEYPGKAVLIHMDLSYNRPETKAYSEILNRHLYCDGMAIPGWSGGNFGEWISDSDPVAVSSSDHTLTGRNEVSVVVAFPVAEDKLNGSGRLALTFWDMDGVVPYVYVLE